jgi:hypothetical protein
MSRRISNKVAFPILLIPIAIVIAIVVWAVVTISPTQFIATQYNADREQIQAAIAEYGITPGHGNYTIPILDETQVYIGGEDVKGPEVLTGDVYYIVAICSLLTSSLPQGIFRHVPRSCETTNCANEGANAEPYITVCVNNCSGHYLWLTTAEGRIASICIGAECEAHGEDGYQGVYP